MNCLVEAKIRFRFDLRWVQIIADYSIEREHGGLRQIAGYGVTVTRGAASAIMFCMGGLMVTMCRNFNTFLRDTRAHEWVPFDSSLNFHMYIGCWALFFTGLSLI